MIHAPHKTPPAPVDTLLGKVRRSLKMSPYPELRTLECDQKSEVTQLRGSVGTYFLKQLAQETVMAVHGVEQVENSVKVRSRSK